MQKANRTTIAFRAYSAMNRQIGRGKNKMHHRHEMLDLVIVDGKARGIIARNLVTGEIERHSAHAVVIASGGYGNVFFLSTNAMGSNATAAGKYTRKGFCKSLLYTNSPNMYSCFRRSSIQINFDVRIIA
jgi:succinate dehydrogenase / fumarate reductase flavoprotein subunit